MFGHFLHQAIIIETPVGQVVGVLADVDVGMHGRWILLIQAFAGEWCLVRDWTCVKTARSST